MNDYRGDIIDKQNIETPLITVLMPIYNSPDIFTAIDSVIFQEYRPIQLIIIDDCSETFDENKIRSFVGQRERTQDLFLIVRKNEMNLGTVKTLNIGLSLAEGRYIFNLAGDDAFYDEKVLSDWVMAFERTGSCVITAKKANYDVDLKKIISISPDGKTINKIKSLSSEELFEKISIDNPISGACTAWRADRLKELDFYDEHYRIIEDYPLFLRHLREGGKIDFLDRIVIKYRGSGTSDENHAFSAQYEKDYCLINKREILPYTKNPKGAEKRLRHWLRNVHFDQWYYEKGKKRNTKFVLQGVYWIYHPMRLYRKIYSSLQRKE